MKKQIIFPIIFCALAIAGCTSRKSDEFAIYLLSQDMSALDASNMDLAQLVLRNEPLISNEDIISYQGNNHIIELTPASYRRFQGMFPQPVKVAGIPFVVCVGSQRIYSGALWSPASSISYDGVIILQSFEYERTTIQLNLGYPQPIAFTGQDPRADPRIMRVLEQANKLKIDSEKDFERKKQ